MTKFFLENAPDQVDAEGYINSPEKLDASKQAVADAIG